MKVTRLCFAALAACLMFAGQASADIVIASYDVFATNSSPNGVPLSATINANATAAGFTSTITNDPDDPLLRRSQTNSASTDGTFGDGVTLDTTLLTAATGGRLQFLNGNDNAPTGVVGADDANFFLNVTNSTADAYDFDELLFDVQVQTPGGITTHNAYSVTFENTTTSTTVVLGSATGLGTGITDVNIDLTGSGIVLGAGETGRFVFNFSGGALNSSSSGAIDNIALTGQVGQEIIKGDVNMDGEVDFLDIPAFIMAITAGEGPAEADCNCDGEISFLDIPVFVDKLTGG